MSTETVEQIRAYALSDIAQIYGLIQEGRYDDASDYCRNCAYAYSPDPKVRYAK